MVSYVIVVITVLLTNVVGYLLGYVTASIKTKEDLIGAIVVDRSDPDGPYLFLELKKPIDDLTDGKKARVLVIDRETLTRK